MARYDDVERMGDILSILRQVRNSGVVAEAEDAQAGGKEPSTAKDADPPEPTSKDQPEIDRDIEDLMTTPKKDPNAKISVETLADDIGVDDPAAFKSAFDLLRGGVAPDDPVMITQLANAFINLMHADASTAQRVVNRLRHIYKTPLPGAK